MGEMIVKSNGKKEGQGWMKNDWSISICLKRGDIKRSGGGPIIIDKENGVIAIGIGSRTKNNGALIGGNAHPLRIPACNMLFAKANIPEIIHLINLAAFAILLRGKDEIIRSKNGRGSRSPHGQDYDKTNQTAQIHGASP